MYLLFCFSRGATKCLKNSHFSDIDCSVFIHFNLRSHLLHPMKELLNDPYFVNSANGVNCGFESPQRTPLSFRLFRIRVHVKSISNTLKLLYMTMTIPPHSEQCIISNRCCYWCYCRCHCKAVILKM